MEHKIRRKRKRITAVLFALTGFMLISLVQPSPSTQVRAEELTPEQYENTLLTDPKYQSNKLYLHYLRDGNTGYDKWGVWAWNEKPADGDGQLFEFTDQDQAGGIAVIDLSTPQFANVVDFGFFIVLKSSMGTASHWKSDSSSDIIIENVKQHERQNKAIHVFTTQGRSATPEFVYQGAGANDPYAGDTGQHTSKNNINSLNHTGLPKPPTSQYFLDHVGVGYQIQVSSYADSNGDGFGDIRGVINKLDYIKSLNVGAIWLTPIQKSESYHGYDTTDYYNIDSRYGTLADYRELVYQADARGIKIVMDLVVNHTSPNHVWYKKSAMLMTGNDINGNQVDYRNFYQWKYSTTPLSEPWYPYGQTNYYYYAKFSSAMPELNYDYQGTRDAIIDVAKYWLGFGIAGFRIDAVKHVYMKDEVQQNSSDVVEDGGYSTDRGKNLHFFKEFSSRIKAMYPNAFIVGENFDGWDQRIAPYYEAIDSQFDFASYYHLVNNALYTNGENSASAEGSSVIPGKYGYYNAKRKNPINSTFTSNHDVNRMLNHVNNTITGSGTSTIENHVHITAANAELAKNKAKVYAAALMFQPGLTWIYYGDEIGMSGNILPNTAANAPERAVGTDWNHDRWYRQPMRWDSANPTAADTKFKFTGFQVEWDDYNLNTLQGVSQQASDPSSFLAYMKDITAIKTTSEIAETIRRGAVMSDSIAGQPRVMVYKIVYKDKTIHTIFNFSGNDVTINQTGTLLHALGDSNLTTLKPYGWIIKG